MEAYLYNINVINTTITVARNMVQTFKAELQFQIAATSMLAHMIEIVPQEQNKNQSRTHNTMPKPPSYT